MIVADKIAEWLHEKGITTVFGIVGAGNATLWDAITRLQKTRIVCCHHEQACVMAAGAYYRISGRISVALVTTGAGSTNAITGVASAYMDSVPVLIISGNEESKYIGAQTRVWGVQGYGSSEMAKECSKYSARINWPHEVTRLDVSYKTALEPRQGPVWVDVPKSVQAENAPV